MRGRVLIVEDDASMRELLAADLGADGFHVETRHDVNDALSFIEHADLDAVVSDLHMPGAQGFDLCRELADSRPSLPVVVITAFGSMESAIGALRAGAYDFLTKPFETEVLARVLDRAIEHRRLEAEVQRLRSATTVEPGAGEILGDSEPMRRALAVVHQVAPRDTSVLITGESGTGKELVARALHDHGRRATGPFVALNCSAFPESLLESQLFGHTKGAFTDARSDRKGLLLEATGGTLFLDEIGDMPLSLQPKLLRVLQERRVRPVGGDREIPVDVRVVAATHQDLETAIEEKRFRGDLYYRINVVEVTLPPLRTRGNDILLLAHHFLRAFATQQEVEVSSISAKAAQRLLAYGWPGNVRELSNCIERAVALAQSDEITTEDLPPRVVKSKRAHVTSPLGEPEGFLPLAEMERRYVLHVFETSKQNRGRTAEILGIDRKTLYRKLLSYGVTSKGE
jgi:two-component system response regulator HydG